MFSSIFIIIFWRIGSTWIRTSWYSQCFEMKYMFLPIRLFCPKMIGKYSSVESNTFVYVTIFAVFFSRTCLYILLIWLLDIQHLELTWSHKINNKNALLKIFPSRTPNPISFKYNKSRAWKSFKFYSSYSVSTSELLINGSK